MSDLKSRIEKLSPQSICYLLKFNTNDVSFGMSGDTRKMLNEQVLNNILDDEIDEVELLICEQGE
jgi:hypothetical protein